MQIDLLADNNTVTVYLYLYCTSMNTELAMNVTHHTLNAVIEQIMSITCSFLTALVENLFCANKDDINLCDLTHYV